MCTQEFATFLRVLGSYPMDVNPMRVWERSILSNTDHILGNESYDISTVYDEPKIFWKVMRCEILQNELANHNLSNYTISQNHAFFEVIYCLLNGCQQEWNLLQRMLWHCCCNKNVLVCLPTTASQLWILLHHAIQSLVSTVIWSKYLKLSIYIQGLLTCWMVIHLRLDHCCICIMYAAFDLISWISCVLNTSLIVTSTVAYMTAYIWR
jgi:hypothetical protein